MRCLFVYFAPIYARNGRHYSRHYNGAFWADRYVRHFESVTVATRVFEATDVLVGTMESADSDGVEFHDIHGYHGEQSVLAHRHRIQRDLRQLVRGVDCVVVRLPSLVGNLVIDECRRQGRPYLVEVVGCAWDSLRHHSLRGAILAPYAWWAMRRRVRLATHVAYVTREFLQSRYPTRGRSIGCSDAVVQVAEEWIIDARTQRAKRRGGPITLGTIGSVDVRYKGQSLVIEALGRLRAEGHEEFYYQLVGDGDRTRLQEIAKRYGVQDRVQFLGSMGHESVMAWLESIDIYAQPSLTEGLPRSLVEAMSRGLPSFGMRVGGIPELLSDEWTVPLRGDRVAGVCSILRAYTVDSLGKQAAANLERAADYTIHRLSTVRGVFYAEFAKYAGYGDHTSEPTR